MNLAESAVNELFPDRGESRELLIRYSGRFADYNANVSYSPSKMTFSLSIAWREIGPEIRQGLIEHLLCKVYGEKRKSDKQDLYHSFMKHLSKFAKVEEKDPFLLFRFQEINQMYFNGLLTEPNLKWGRQALRKLGHYEYASDTIVISSIFEQAKDKADVLELLDFVLYHEMLHKKHTYDHKKTRARHHSAAFKADEALWHDYPAVEDKLKRFLRGKRLRKAFSW